MQERVFYSRVFGLATLTALALALFWILRPFLVPLLWAALLAILLFPLNTLLRSRLGDRRALTALLLTLSVVLVVVLPTALLLSLFVAQASDLALRLQAVAKEYRIASPSDVLTLPVVADAIRWVSERVPVSSEQTRDWLVQGGQRALQLLVTVSGTLVTSTLSVIANVLMAVFLFFFFLRDGERMMARLVGLIPLEDKRKGHLVAHLSAVTTAVVLGSLVTAVVQGSLVGIGFAIAGLPAPVVFAALAMVASLIPVIGSTLVWVPAALVLAAQGRWGWALFLTVWCVALVHSADNFVRPLFISSRVRISTLPVFIGLLGGVSAFGAIGMFLGPVIVALALALVEFWEEVRREAEREAALPPSEEV